MSREMVEVTVEIMHETDNAVLVSYDGTEAWIPKSQIEDITELDDGLFEILIPEWLAEDKELI